MKTTTPLAAAAASANDSHQNDNNNSLSLLVNVSHHDSAHNHFNLPFNLIDPYALSVVTYLQFCQLPYTIIPLKQSHLSNTLLQTKLFNNATSPVLNRNGKQVAQGPVQCLNYLKAHGVNLDLHLSIPDTSSSSLQQIQNEIEIFINLMSEKLLPLFIWQVWGFGNYEDYSDLVWNGWFNNRNSILKWIFVPLSRRRYSDWLSNRSGTTIETSALECLEALSVLLGDKKYFYGTQPSTLDAVVYGYLASFKKIQFKCSTSRDLLSRFSNLDTFVDTVTSEYFANVPVPESLLQQQPTSAQSRSSSSTSNNTFVLRSEQPRRSQQIAPIAKYSNNRRNLYLSIALGTIGAYILYVFGGIIFAPKIVYVVVDQDTDAQVYYDNQEEEHDPSIEETTQ